MTQAKPAPRSWAEDVSTYRDTRGSRSLGTVTSKESVPPRYARTNFVPFAATTHPLYPYNDFVDNPDQTRVNPVVQADRYNRHGWGDTTLIKEEGYAGVLHPRAEPLRGGKGQPGPPCGKDGRKDLFGTLQYSPDTTPDSWIGNSLIDPTKGKGTVQVPMDPKGRRDLFDVLHARNPGMPSDDSWLGHSLIDPAKGKAHPMGPEERRGRRDLGEVYNQQILRETKERQQELQQRGADPYGDGWIGNQLVHPACGKAPVYGSAAAAEVMMGTTFRDIPEGHTDMPRRHNRAVLPPYQDQARQVLNGTDAGVDDWGKGGKRLLGEPQGPTTLPRNDHLYAHMTFKRLDSKEQNTLTKAFDDGRHYTRRNLSAPQSQGPGQGKDMLHWLPQQRIASYVPYAGLAQERRGCKTLAASTPPGSLAATLSKK